MNAIEVILKKVTELIEAHNDLAGRVSVLEKAERSGVAQRCLPSATGSASAAPNTEQPPCVSVASALQATSHGKAEDGPVADSSSVQLPVSGSAGVERELKIEWKRLYNNEKSAFENNLIQAAQAWRFYRWGIEKALEIVTKQPADAPSAAGASGGS